MLVNVTEFAGFRGEIAIHFYGRGEPSLPKVTPQKRRTILTLVGRTKGAARSVNALSGQRTLSIAESSNAEMAERGGRTEEMGAQQPSKQLRA